MLDTIQLTAKEKQFTKAYFKAVDFTETGDTEQPDSGEELDSDFIRESIIDCLAFYSQIRCYLSDDAIEQAGHDFWFTRQGHGVGFYDRPEVYGDMLANRFTEKAQAFGEVNAYFENWYWVANDE